MTEHRILQGDVLDGLRTLPDNCIQCTVTSPPYFGLRNYGVDGQIGLEETPEKFVAKITEVFREVRRVLRDDGTLWLNFGDSYASGKGTCNNPGGGEDSIETKSGRKDEGVYQLDRGNISDLRAQGLKPKDMIGIPWRVAFALQADGWYLRSDIIWAKPNPMPESVTDRPTKAHEYIFLLTKSARYYYDADAIREPVAESTLGRPPVDFGGKKGREYKENIQTDDPNYRGGSEQWGRTFDYKESCANGRNARTVWTITTQARPEAHFATFPDEIPRRCIKAGTSEYGCCPKCGAPYQRIVERENPPKCERSPPRPNAPNNDSAAAAIRKKGDNWNGPELTAWRIQHPPKTSWKPGCSCDAGEPVPCVVLDPFMGSGTVAVIARELNRSSIGCELNPEYVKIIKKRLQSDSQLDTGVVSYKFEEVTA